MTSIIVSVFIFLEISFWQSKKRLYNACIWVAGVYHVTYILFPYLFFMKITLFRAIRVTSLSVFVSLVSTTTIHAALYSPVECTSQSFFQSNTCDLCFEEKTLIPPGAEIRWLFDTWTNKTTQEHRVYEDEQTIKPTMINLWWSGTKWIASRPNPNDMWEFTPEVQWTNTGANGRKVTAVTQWKSMKFIQQKSTDFYTLQTSDKKNGEFIGMMKFPLAYREIDPSWSEGPKKLHYECVTYRYDSPIVQPAPKPVQPETPPAPKQITATKTGPEVWLIGLIAWIIGALLIMRTRKNPTL